MAHIITRIAYSAISIISSVVFTYYTLLNNRMISARAATSALNSVSCLSIKKCVKTPHWLKAVAKIK